jgi:type III secretion protein R
MDLSQFTPGSALDHRRRCSRWPRSVAVMVTSFTKIVVTLSLLRNALGLQQVPPNIVLNGLALILSLYVMYPVGQRDGRMRTGANPSASVSTDIQALGAVMSTAKEPLRDFLMKHSDAARTRLLPEDRAARQRPEQAGRYDRSRLHRGGAGLHRARTEPAFQIGFLIFLPFLVIDLVMSNILLAMGMMMLSPTTMSLPFKLLLFVLIDGWVKLAHGLVLSYT